MSDILNGNALIAIGIVALLLILYFGRRVYNVQADETFFIRDWENDFKRGLKKGINVLLDPRESVIRGANKPRYEFPSIDGADNRTTGHLRNEKTGALDLKQQFCAPSFIALTNEPRRMRVDAWVQFKVDSTKLQRIHDLGNSFGRALVKRIENAFSDQFGARKDEEVRKDRHVISEAVLKELVDFEKSKPLGLEFEIIDFEFKEERASLRGPGEKGEDGRPLSAPGQGVAFMDVADLDAIMNLFTGPERMRALLAILEMQTRRDIADALTRSGHLVVVTAQELGLAGTAVQLDAMKKLLPPDGSTPPGG